MVVMVLINDYGGNNDGDNDDSDGNCVGDDDDT